MNASWFISIVLVFFGLMPSIAFADPYCEFEKNMTAQKDTLIKSYVRNPQLEKDFKDILSQFPELSDTQLVITTNSQVVLAQTFPGIVVVHLEVVSLPRKFRIFILAHELGHIQKHHWNSSFATIANICHSRADIDDQSKQLSTMSHAHEFEADDFGTKVLNKLGYTAKDAIEMLNALGDIPATLTHPSVAARINALR